MFESHASVPTRPSVAAAVGTTSMPPSPAGTDPTGRQIKHRWKAFDE
jgi:hypothetical protein